MSKELLECALIALEFTVIFAVVVYLMKKDGMFDKHN